MASISKIKGQRGVKFEYTLQVAGRQERKRYETKEEAEAALQDRQRELREGRITGVISKRFGDVAEQYLGYKQSTGKKSLNEDREVLERRLLPFFGEDTKVSEITAEAIARYQMARATEINAHLGRPVTASTINRHISILRGLLRLAKRWGHLREVPYIQMNREPQGRVRFLDTEEIPRLLAACAPSKNPHLTRIVTLALNTGCRKGEILGLTWDRVDFSRGVILLEKTKNGRAREIPMNSAADRVLSDLRRTRLTAEGPVFPGRDGKEWGRMEVAFDQACARAGIKDFRFHDTRHTFASHLVMQGRPLLEVKELLGHQTLAMTMRYAHLAPGRLRDAVASLDAMFAASPVSSATAPVPDEDTQQGVVSK